MSSVSPSMSVSSVRYRRGWTKNRGAQVFLFLADPALPPSSSKYGAPTNYANFGIHVCPACLKFLSLPGFFAGPLPLANDENRYVAVFDDVCPIGMNNVQLVANARGMGGHDNQVRARVPDSFQKAVIQFHGSIRC